MRAAALLLVLLAGCQPAHRPPDDAYTSDAPLRWRPCEGCRIECSDRGRVTIVSEPPFDPFDPVPDCTGCEGFCDPPQRDAGPASERVFCAHVEGPIYEPTCDGVLNLTDTGRRNVWRDSWR